jgi:hypothetical protein
MNEEARLVKRMDAGVRRHHAGEDSALMTLDYARVMSQRAGVRSGRCFAGPMARSRQAWSARR